jgi:RHS repeat-associated protein
VTGGNPSANVVYGRGTDELLLRTDTAQARWLVADGLGSALALLDPTGTVQTQYSYGAFGATSAAGAASANSVPRDEKTTEPGLYYYRARYYSGGTHRFISQDPIEFTAGDTNLYRYVFDSPTNLRDPTGEIVPLIAAGAGLGGVLGGGAYALTAGRYFTWQGLGGAVLGGAVAGGIGVVATPIVAAAGLGTGLTGTAVVAGGAGLAGGAVSAAIDPNQDFTPGYAAASAASGALGGAWGAHRFPTPGMCVFGQVGSPAPGAAYGRRALAGMPVRMR